MKQYLDQLINDITEAKLNLAWPYVKQLEVDHLSRSAVPSDGY